MVSLLLSLLTLHLSRSPIVYESTAMQSQSRILSLLARLVHVRNRPIQEASSSLAAGSSSSQERSTNSHVCSQSPTLSRSPIPFTCQKDCPVGNPAVPEEETSRFSLSLSLEQSPELFPQPVPATTPHDKRTK